MKKKSFQQFLNENNITENSEIIELWEYLSFLKLKPVLNEIRKLGVIISSNILPQI